MGRGCVLGGWLAKIDYWGSRLLITFVYFRNFLLVELQICVDWQRYWKQFSEDIRNVRIRFEFLFRCLFPKKGIIGRNHPSTRVLTWSGKTRCKVVLKDFSEKQTTWKEKIKKGQSGKSKRAEIGVHSFVDSFASKALALWLYLPPQLRGSWFSSDQRSKSHKCRRNGNTQFLLNFVEQNPKRVTLSSLRSVKMSTNTAWSTMAVTPAVSSRVLYPIEQSSNTDSWIDRGKAPCFS